MQLSNTEKTKLVANDTEIFLEMSIILKVHMQMFKKSFSIFTF